MDKENIELLVLWLFGAFGFILFLVLLVFFQRRYEAQQEKRGKDNLENPSFRKRSRSLTAERSALVVPSIVREFTLSQLEAATGKFCQDNLIKTGHSGDIFSGIMEGGEIVVIKRLQLSKSERDFYQAEMDVYGRVLDQRFLVPLLGQCLEGDEKLLVYQYMPNGDLATSLARARGTAIADDNIKDSSQSLPWGARLKIAIGVARALAYLHHECRPRLAHRNIQASSVLMSSEFEIKLGSLGEAERLDGGAIPAYDIYCFGKLLMDLISGLDISGLRDSNAEEWLRKAIPLMSMEGKEGLMELVDGTLGMGGEEEGTRMEVVAMAIVGRACMDPKSLQHLSMKRVVELLECPQTIIF